MKLSFTSCQLLKISRDSGGGRATFSSSLSSGIMKALNWVEMPECLTGGKLEGELAAMQIELTPKEPELKKHATSIDCQNIGKFETMRLELENSKGKGHRTELRFLVLFADPNGCAKLEAYMLTCDKSTMTVSYEKQAVQEDLLPVDEADEHQSNLTM